jgi:hypothetical protein
MHINESVDSCGSKFVNEGFYLGEVGIVIDSSSSLDSLPHNSKTDKVHSPFLEVGDILVI